MNRIIACLLFIGVLASSTLLVVEACTPDTCTGPVTKYFSTPNCSDTPNIYQVSQVNAGTCEPFDSTSQSWSCDTEGFVIVSTFSDTTCSRRSAVLTYGVDVCIQTDTNAAVVYSCSVNDTFTAGKTADTSLPIRDGDSVQCASPGNCSALNPAFYYTWYTTLYANDFTCASANASFSTAFQQSANFSIGGCFTDSGGYFNTKYTCTADELIAARYQSPDGCSGTPYYVFASSRACNSPVMGKKRDEQGPLYYRMTFTCDVPATPQAPTSSSPSQSPSRITMMVASFLAVLGSILACL